MLSFYARGVYPAMTMTQIGAQTAKKGVPVSYSPSGIIAEKENQPFSHFKTLVPLYF